MQPTPPTVDLRSDMMSARVEVDDQQNEEDELIQMELEEERRREEEEEKALKSENDELRE